MPEDQPKRILVVDDEIVLAKIITTRLKKLGYDANTVNSGYKALEFIAHSPVDLVILDLLMPGMDGYETTKEIRANPDTSSLPIIMLTAKVSQDTKIRALKLGIDDFMTKPYDAEELAARIESVLRRAQTRVAGTPADKTPPISAREKQRIDFLRVLLEKDIPYIKPEYDMGTYSGYTWGEARDFFKSRPGAELEELLFLEERGVLARRFYDKILVCPFCGHHNLNLREVSPTTRTADIVQVSTIHHYRCGYVGVEPEFMQGIDLICPKCSRELSAIGVDYDKPGKMFFDNESGEKFTEPDVVVECRNCKREFEPGDAVRQNIYAFVPTDRLPAVVDEGRFFAVNFEQELLDQDVNIYNLNYFRQKFREEMIRSDQFSRPLSLVMIEIEDFDRLQDERGESAAQQMLSELTTILRESLWSVDVPARYDKNTFISLLPEADHERANKVVSDIKEQTSRRVDANFRLDIRVASYPEDGTTRDELLEKLVRG